MLISEIEASNLFVYSVSESIIYMLFIYAKVQNFSGPDQVHMW